MRRWVCARHLAQSWWVCGLECLPWSAPAGSVFAAGHHHTKLTSTRIPIWEPPQALPKQLWSIFSSAWNTSLKAPDGVWVLYSLCRVSLHIASWGHDVLWAFVFSGSTLIPRFEDAPLQLSCGLSDSWIPQVFKYGWLCWNLPFPSPWFSELSKLFHRLSLLTWHSASGKT